MFDNASQLLHTAGGVGVLIVAPILRSLATLCVVLSLYKDIKAYSRPHLWKWILCAFFIPIWTRLAYFIYYRFIDKPLCAVEPNHKQKKQGRVCLILAIIAYILSAVIAVISAITMGAGYIKSIVDDEPLLTVYDSKGNEYHDLYDIPLYDREGNIYVRDLENVSLFSPSYYRDQNGNLYEEDQCYIDEDGYFFFDKDNTLTVYEKDDTYCTDGDKRYFQLWQLVYWEKDGSIWIRNRNGRDTEVFPKP